MENPNKKFSVLDDATKEWYMKMAELEEGCDISAGGMDIDGLLIDSERVEE